MCQSTIYLQSTAMGFRFRRRIKILPGVHLNWGKRGTSWSIGGRGATMNISRRGIRNTYSIPGNRYQLPGQTSKWSGDRADPDIGTRRTFGCAGAFILVSGFLALLAIANGIGTAFHLTGYNSFPYPSATPYEEALHPSATPYDEGWQPSPSPTPDRLAESHTDAATAPTAAPVAPAKHTKRHRNRPDWD